MLAPVGVLPEFHRQGLGKELIKRGVAHLKSLDVDAIMKPMFWDMNYEPGAKD